MLHEVAAGLTTLLLSTALLGCTGTAEAQSGAAREDGAEALVAAAAAWARAGVPAPYDVPLAWPASPRVTAWVYTPLVRAALWLAQQPADAPASVPHELLAPVVLVALRAEPECCPRHEPNPVAVEALLVPDVDVRTLRPDPARGHLPAAWAGLGAEAIANVDPSRAKDVSAVVAFPANAFRPGQGISALVTMRSVELNGGLYKVHHTGLVRADWR